MHREGRRGLGHLLHGEPAVDVDAGSLHALAGGREQVQGGLAVHLDPDVLEDAHRLGVDAVEGIVVEQGVRCAALRRR